MPDYRNDLPQLDGKPYVTDGGLETTLIYHDGLDLPDFAAFELLDRPEGVRALTSYYRAYAAIAVEYGAGLILESPTWRANPDWGARLGCDREALAAVNRRAIEFLERFRREFRSAGTPVVISGCIGPRGDGYEPASQMTDAEAEAYHAGQITTFAQTTADLVTALTLNYAEEAIGIVRAAAKVWMPVVISFTVETDGRLPTGQTLKSAIEQVDSATSAYASYYMINCAHPTHIEHALAERGPWARRIRGLRANASRKSHAELDVATELDAGDPVELGAQYARLKAVLPLTVLGGCCGTDHRHVERIASACLPLFAS